MTNEKPNVTIKLSVVGYELELTLDQARSLYEVLDDLLNPKAGRLSQANTIGGYRQ